MKTIPRKITAVILSTLCCILLTACIYDVPLTPKPTRKVETGLLGNWIPKDEKDKKTLKVRKLDDYNYVIYLDEEIYRVFHSDFENTPFVSVQSLDATNRNYAFFTWKLSGDGNELTLRGVDSDFISNTNKDTASLQKAIKANLQNTNLLNEPGVYTREK
jgi:hypothetical protein